MERSPQNGYALVAKLFKSLCALVHSCNKGFVFLRTLGERLVPVGYFRFHTFVPAVAEIGAAVPADGDNAASVMPVLRTLVYALEVVVHIVKTAYCRVFARIFINVLKLVLIAAHPGRLLLSRDYAISVGVADVFVQGLGFLACFGV